MIFGLFLLFIIFVLWMLFVRGVLFKIILFFAGWFGITYLLSHYVAGMAQPALNSGGYHMSWASLIASIICVMALATTRN